MGDFPVVAFSLAYELELAGLVDCLDLAGIPAFADDARPPRPGASPAGRDRRPAHLLEPGPGRPLRRRHPARRGGGDDRRAGAKPSASSPLARGAARDAGRAARVLRAVASTASSLPPDRRGRRRAAPRPLADPHAAHRALEHVPHRARARLPPRLHLLRDAPVDQRRHAPGRPRAGGVAHPRRRAPGGPGRRGGHRPPGAARDPAPHRRQRARGRHLQPARRPPERRDRRACSSAAATGRSPPPPTARPSGCATSSSARPRSGTCWRAAAALPRPRDDAVQALHDARRCPARPTPTSTSWGASRLELAARRAAGGAGDRAVRRQAQHAARRRGVRVDRGDRRPRWPACARRSRGGSRCARPRPSGPGSSTGWPRAASRPAAPPRGPPAPAAASPTGRPRSPRSRRRRSSIAPSPQPASGSAAIASISIRAPLGRPAA